MNQFEYILFFQKGNKQINNCGTSDVLSFDNIKTKDKYGKNIHDTQKPISLMKVLVENSSNENDLVLDPFMGSGSTIFACNQLNRNFIGFEINYKYFDYVNTQLTNREKLDKRLQEIKKVELLPENNLDIDTLKKLSVILTKNSEPTDFIINFRKDNNKGE